MNDELEKFSDELKTFIDKSNEEFGGEKVQPYLLIMEGILLGVNADITAK